MVQAELVHVEEGTNNNITLWVNFKVDGVDTIWLDKNKQPLIRNGKNVWPYTMGWWNLSGKTNQQILQWIKVNIEHQCDNLIKKKYREVTVDSTISTKLINLVGTTLTKETATIDMDTNNDGTKDLRIELSTDGTYTETVI